MTYYEKRSESTQTTRGVISLQGLSFRDLIHTKNDSYMKIVLDTHALSASSRSSRAFEKHIQSDVSLLHIPTSISNFEIKIADNYHNAFVIGLFASGSRFQIAHATKINLARKCGISTSNEQMNNCPAVAG